MTKRKPPSKRRSERPKSTEKSTGKAVPTGALIPQPHGGAIRNGGTNIGGPGRPPDEFKRTLQALASSDAVLAQVQAILENPSHPQFMSALKWATEHGYGKPDQHVTGSAAVAMKLVVEYRDETRARDVG